ncbi:hypothetical protein [Salinibacter ruber]|nr:hypothetical protein [Salinibacter ruber]MCS4101485.1 hypothetical protein [Salinibacter ruber]
MPDEKQPNSEEKRKEPSGRPLTEEEWIELMNKHDRLSQYAKKRREKSDDGEQKGQDTGTSSAQSSQAQ